MPHKDPETHRAYTKRYHRKWYLRNREAKLARNSAWAKSHPKDVAQYRKRYRRRHLMLCRRRGRDSYFKTQRRSQRIRELKRKFGLSETGYAALETKQKGLCAICKQPETALHLRSPDSRKHTLQRLSVDHDHTTGRIRGLLCKRCNAGLGHFADDPSCLQAAVAYLMAQTRQAKRYTQQNG